MSSFQAAYASVGLFSLILAIAFFFVDGMLLWSIVLFVLAIMMIFVRAAWGIAGFADKAIKRLDD